MKKEIALAANIIVITLIAAMLALAGCKSKKVIGIDTGGDLKSKSHTEVLNDILAHELDYRTITTKGKISFAGIDATAIFKLVKDEFIQVSIRYILGVEVMRVDLTPESIVVVDRLSGKYAEVNIGDAEIKDLAAFNFYNIQALLTNKLFLAGNKKVTKEDYGKFQLQAVDNHFVLQTADKNNIEYQFFVDASDRISSVSLSHSAKDLHLLWRYDQFVEDENFIYPTAMTAKVKVKKKEMKADISYSDLDVNTQFNIDKSKPTRYQKVEILDLINTYIKIK